MKNRPLILVILSFLHFFEPLLKIFYFKAKTHFDLITILTNVTTVSNGNLKGLIDFWFVFPLAGVALISVKRWAYPLFISVQIYSVITHLTYERFTWPYFAEVPFYSSFILLFLNTMLIIYVSLPDVRQLFFNKHMRWWETRIRYNIKLPITLWHTNPEKLEQACLINISDTGAFLLHNKEIEIGEIIHLNISFLEHHLQLKAQVVRSQFDHGQKGVGVRFLHTSPFAITKFRVRNMVKTIKRFQKNQSKLSSAIN